MQAALRLTARVLAGKRVEFTSPDLTEGEDVELIVLKPEQPAPVIGNTTYISALDFLDALPPSTLTSADWEQIERELQEEKDAWER